jgi:hypothetical protein
MDNLPAGRQVDNLLIDNESRLQFVADGFFFGNLVHLFNNANTKNNHNRIFTTG